jgi:hypothetical protein
MMEYFTLKKIRQHQAEKRAQEHLQSPVLTEEDENFLERIVSAEGTPPALPDRPHFLNPEVASEVGDSTTNDAQVVVYDDATTSGEKSRDIHDKGKGKGKEKEHSSDKDKKKANRFSFLTRSKKNSHDGLKPNEGVVTPNEATKEEEDINRVLDELNLAAVNNRAFSISKESQVLVQKFTLILKDLVNGVPTAYDDLVKLINDSEGTLSKSYENLPSFLKKLVVSLPNKLTSNLAPELLAVATEAQGLSTAAASGGIAGAAKKMLSLPNLKQLVTKPGAIAGMLKAIMNALKLRWPAFIGTNVLLSLGLFSESNRQHLPFLSLIDSIKVNYANSQ